MKKIALVSFGNEESYGLLFVGSEMKKHGSIKFFDNEMSECLDQIVEYNPDYVCFSPMTTFYLQAKALEDSIKDHIDVVSIYGGHHATNCGYQCGDLTIVGAVHDIDITKRGIIKRKQTKPENLGSPAREEYYRDIPRFKNRYRKMMLSYTGCPFNCSYCSSSSSTTKRLYGDSKNHLRRRDISTIIREAKFIKDTTHEIEWVDDDIFYGDEAWLIEFLKVWKKEINIPMYVSTTTVNALKASMYVLQELRDNCNCIGVGVQSINPTTLKLINRGWETKDKVRKTYEKLTSWGFKVNLQMIAGFPVEDTVSDALETLFFLRDTAKGSIISCYPLQIYPNTDMESYCASNGFKLNKECFGDTNSAKTAIDFGHNINEKIKKICKLATFIVKYGIDNNLVDVMLDMNIGGADMKLSLLRYYETIRDRLPDKADSIFDSVINSMNLRY